MNESRTQEAYQWMNDMEEGVSVSAGILDLDAYYVQRKREAAMESDRDLLMLFAMGRLFNLERRNRGINITQLAQEIDCAPTDLLRLEGGYGISDPQIVTRLAQMFHVNIDPLLQLADPVYGDDNNMKIESAALRLIDYGSVQSLTPKEREALDTFVEVLKAG